jgi:retron-type reverse transcriptase
LEEGRIMHPHTGTPQGGVISPLLANIYLHEVVDTWFEHEVKPRLAGPASLFRYADDMVMVLASERDAQRVMAVTKRLGVSVYLHPTRQAGGFPAHRHRLSREG